MADLFSSIGDAVGGLFGMGSSSDPFKDASKQYTKYADQAASYQNPFYQSGKRSIPQYEDWLKGMSDPSEFINNLMGGYSTSPYSQYEQDQSMRASNNAASASGLTGSTPYQLQAQENASNLANKDMEQWLSHVLGINTEYGQGLNTNINRGQQAGNQLSGIYSNLGSQMGNAAYGSSMAQQSSLANLLSGLLGIGSNIPGLSKYNIGY